MKEKFRDYREKARKVIYELDGEIIDYSISLKDFLDALGKYEKVRKP